MRGYWNLVDETAVAVTHLDGIRYYRTGDICKYLADGSLFYVGRKDNEVNIGGYRVHLNEVRRVINSVPQVHDSEIVLLDSKYGEKILAAGILLDKGSHLHVDQKIEQIHHRLRDSSDDKKAYLQESFRKQESVRERVNQDSIDQIGRRPRGRDAVSELVKVECTADIDLVTLAGVGRLTPLEENSQTTTHN
jgi:acyl-CoA synthetase (AMP-forming)/AMP-acid ligase II